MQAAFHGHTDSLEFCGNGRRMTSAPCRLVYVSRPHQFLTPLHLHGVANVNCRLRCARCFSPNASYSRREKSGRAKNINFGDKKEITISDSAMPSKSTVLVTGGSGFIGQHCIIQLVDAGYTIRTTVRKLSRENEVRSTLQSAGCDLADNITFFVADLTSDAGWTEAVAGCDFVLHVASPFPTGNPKDENELIIPAREGTLRVLRAARDSGTVKRVVLTSSFAAIGYGWVDHPAPFTEVDWTDPASKDVAAYSKSKSIAERAAWDFMTSEGGKLELSVVNPVAVLGPVLSADYSSSIQIVQRMLDGSLPALPQLSFGIIDVRDVASLHLLAMTNPAAKGERFLAVSGDFTSMKEIAEVLRTRKPEISAKVPTYELPNWVVKCFGYINSTAAGLAPELGKKKSASSSKAQTVLGWTPRTPADAIVASAESLHALGLLKHFKK